MLRVIVIVIVFPGLVLPDIAAPRNALFALCLLFFFFAFVLLPIDVDVVRLRVFKNVFGVLLVVRLGQVTRSVLHACVHIHVTYIFHYIDIHLRSPA